MGSPGDLPDGQNWLIARLRMIIALLKTGEARGALATSDELEIALDDLPEGEKASYAAPLATLERENEAEALMFKVNWTKFSPIEAALLKGTRRVARRGKNCTSAR